MLAGVDPARGDADLLAVLDHLVALIERRERHLVPKWDVVTGRHLDGVVEVRSKPRGASLVPSSVVGELATGLRSVPADVERVAYLDAGVLDSLGLEPVLRMISWLDQDHAAVVRAVPVTDALKTVRDGRIVGSVDRSGLYAPQPPHIVRRDALDAALGTASSSASTTDLAGLLVQAGHAVRLVREGQPPMTLSSSV